MTALSAATVLGACSSDESDGGEQPKTEGSPSAASESPTFYPMDGCRAEVKVSGAVDAKWSGKGWTAPQEGGALVYQSSHKANSIAIFAASDSAPASVSLIIDGTTYSISDESVIEAKPDGTRATVDGTADGKGPKVVAKIACQSSGG